MQDIKDRIMHLMKTKNINATQLSEIMNVQRSGISHILSGRNKPGTDFIIKLKESFPEFSLDWLLMGKGPATLSPVIIESDPAQVRQNTIQPSLFDFDDKNETVEEKNPEKQASIPAESAAFSDTAPDNTEPQRLNTKKENPPSVMKRDDKEIVRIIVVYSDNTFSALNPAD
ncbi:MAG: helix-turn-helix domain-containing protein [Bacteroidia bacterium]|jgi:transcriptional regulator with XRE-family HTH domain|nr:helix-turn-helix domain-containing protein [Bacteroidia bacterium]